MKNKKNQCKDLLIMTLAVAVIAAAVFFFLVPSHAAISSIAGLAIVLSNFVPLQVSAITMILNIALLIVGFFFCGRDFGFKTVYTTILLPLFLWVLEMLFPHNQSLTGDAMLDVVSYIFLVSVGISVLFNMNASSGGLDIVAKILNKYFHIQLGTALSMAGMCIALSSAFAYDKKTVVLSVIGTYVNGLVLDHFIFGQNIKKRVCIISQKQEDVAHFILNTLHSGATIYEAKGAYDGKIRHEIETIVDRNEYQKLLTYIEKEVPDAFMTVYTVSDIKYRPKV